MVFAASAAAVLLLAQAASVASPASQTAKASPPLVCKSIGDTGSHFVHHVCHTPEEWAQITADAQGSVQQYQKGSSLGTPH